MPMTGHATTVAARQKACRISSLATAKNALGPDHSGLRQTTEAGRCCAHVRSDTMREVRDQPPANKWWAMVFTLVPTRPGLGAHPASDSSLDRPDAQGLGLQRGKRPIEAARVYVDNPFDHGAGLGGRRIICDHTSTGRGRVTGFQARIAGALLRMPVGQRVRDGPRLVRHVCDQQGLQRSLRKNPG